MYEAVIHFQVPAEQRAELRHAVLEELSDCAVLGIVDSYCEGDNPDDLAAAPAVFYVHTEDEAQRIIRPLQGRWPIQVSIHRLSNASWQNCWQEEFRILQTDCFLVSDQQELLIAGDDRTPLLITGGGVFGAGDHATTEACLRALEPLLTSETGDFLDVGTGTGILAIAAAKLRWRATGTDIDPQCLSVAQQNARQNQISCRWVLGPPPMAVDGGYRVAVCNILVPELYRVIPDILTRIEESAALLLAGFPAHRSSEVVKNLAGMGMELYATEVVRGWPCLSFRRFGLN